MSVRPRARLRAPSGDVPQQRRTCCGRSSWVLNMWAFAMHLLMLAEALRKHGLEDGELDVLERKVREHLRRNKD